MNGRNKHSVECDEAEDEGNIVTFHPSVVPGASDLKVDKMCHPEFHYDEFRGLYYINASDIKPDAASVKNHSVFSPNDKSKKQDDEVKTLVTMSEIRLTSMK